ncbi:MAG: DUF3373 family protein [Bacteriovorax sp.]|nr:DUF3373 family protein [Bacteriovorax sp.]
MKKKVLISALALTSASLVAAEVSPTLEQRVEQLETNSYLQSIQWNGSFDYRYDSITDEDTGGVKTHYTPMSLRVLLDASTQVDPKIQFYTRFGLTKFTNDFVNQNSSTDDTYRGPRSHKSGGLLLERAYVNYAITKDIVASLGRLPTIDGAPAEMWDNAPRLGTYPLLAYGAILDGVALTYNWGFLPSQYKFSTRFIYTPLYNVATESATFQNISKPTYGGTSGPMQENATMYTLMADFSTKAIPYVGEFAFVAQQVTSKDIHIHDTVDRGTAIGAVLASPAAGGNGVPNTTGNSGANALTFAGSTERFNLNYLTLNTTMSNIMNSNVSFGFTYLRTQVQSKGYLESSASLNAVFGSSALGKKLGIGKGVMTDRSEDKVNGSIILGTLTYITPFSFMKNPLIGGEYLHGTKNSQYWGFTANNFTSFYATRGDAYHAFWAQPLTSGVNVRLGYMYQVHQWSKGYIGAPTASDLNEKTIYANFRYTF